MLTRVREIIFEANKHGWTIIVGDAEGVDEEVIKSCDFLGVDIEVHGANGKMRRRTKRGKNIAHEGSYFDRNKEMAHVADRCEAIWDGKSRGTKHTFTYMNKLGKPVNVHRSWE
jgi:hypothetical protein